MKRDLSRGLYRAVALSVCIALSTPVMGPVAQAQAHAPVFENQNERQAAVDSAASITVGAAASSVAEPGLRSIYVVQMWSSDAIRVQITGSADQARFHFSLCPSVESSCEFLGREKGYSAAELQQKEQQLSSRARNALIISAVAGLLGAILAGAGSYALMQTYRPTLLRGNYAQQLVGAFIVIVSGITGGTAATGLSLHLSGTAGHRELSRVLGEIPKQSAVIVVDDIAAVTQALSTVLMSR